jgi:hypothetical protein
LPQLDDHQSDEETIDVVVQDGLDVSQEI